MAKKIKSYSQVAATEALDQLGQKGSTPEELVYHLLRIFSGLGDGQISRIKDGRGNSANDNKTVLVKNLIAYRPVNSELKENLYDELIGMKDDTKISKHNPRLYVVSNGKDVIAYDPKINDWYDNTIDRLWRDFVFLEPLAGIEPAEHYEEALADVKSAELMAKVYDDIRRYNDIKDKNTVHSLNVFMSRLLFCFFAEDTGLFPGENLFTNTLKTHTKEDGSDLAEFIDRAFIVMSTNNKQIRESYPKFFDEFPYVNGGLFKEHFPVPVLSRRARTLIINCGEYNWKEINPDIFGSMIQAVITPEQRSGLGMHYTSVPNIEKLIKPLFLNALDEEFEAACKEAKEKKDRGQNANKSTQRLRALLARLSKIKFFDPACGSGNFLIISYKRIRDLEIRIWKAMRDIANMTVLPISAISLTQFYGIEIDEYACDTAMLSLWLAEHQMNVEFNGEFGIQPETLPLKPSGHIIQGNACRINWDEVCPHTPEDEVYIMGNPPYLGSSMQNEVQKKDLEAVCGQFQNYKNLDYIASWFYKGASYIKGSKSKCAFVTTNSICQGDSVNLLWPNVFSQDVEISFAYESFKWRNSAKSNASVIVVIIGLISTKLIKEKILYSDNKRKHVSHINAYLINGNDIFLERRGTPICEVPMMTRGSMPSDGGGLILTEEEYFKIREFIPSEISPIKKYMGAEDFLNDIHRYCIWVDKQDYEILDKLPQFHQRFEIVRTSRLQSDTPGTKEYAKYPYLFRQPQYKPTNSIIVPGVSSERRNYIPMGFVDNNTVISNAAFAIYDAEKWLFAMLNSNMHNIWVRTVCGRLKSDFRYTVSQCYNSFPFPELTTSDKRVLEDLAQNILNIRDMNFDMTLGEMYNPESMPEELKQAHHELDLAVERIYRHEPFQSDEERLEHLFKLYAQMVKNERKQ
ncbi:MAG: class I SAM-dependent DNA methyltransferase [Muribaculaceae bacterium]|nr:class I SAM-dependent DNA methyltransferase [Muribaculaceae bacterium]